MAESTFLFMKLSASMAYLTEPLQLTVDMGDNSTLEPCLMEAFCRMSNTTDFGLSYRYSKEEFSTKWWNRSLPMESQLRMQCPLAFKFGGENNTYDFKCNMTKQWEPATLMPTCKSKNPKIVFQILPEK